MELFTWLLVGHLVGDWLLQNDWMAKGKKQGLVTLAGMSHFIVYTLIVAATLWWALLGTDYSLLDFLLRVIIIFVSHWLIDATSIVQIWMKLLQQSNLLVVQMMVDQIFHILVLVVVVELF